jgi:FAD/FMN-containing dehydrogenase
MARSLLLKLSLLLQFLQLSYAAPTASTQAACDAIKKALSGKLALPNESAYNKENNDYHNIGLAELKPACIAHPTTAQEVSTIVKILGQHSDVWFSVKSGGHDPNVGHSSVKNGVLISLRKIAGVQNDPKRKVAYVKPGGHWNEIIEPLDKQGVTVVGGRLG